LRGALVGADGAPRPHTNVSEDVLTARLYEDGPESGCILLIALCWNSEHASGIRVAFELGSEVGSAGKVAVLLLTNSTATQLPISYSGRLVGAPQRPGTVNVYRIIDPPAHTSSANHTL